MTSFLFSSIRFCSKGHDSAAKGSNNYVAHSVTQATGILFKQIMVVYQSISEEWCKIHVHTTWTKIKHAPNLSLKHLANFALLNCAFGGLLSHTFT